MLLDNKICKISNYVRALNDLIKDMEQNGFSKSAMMLKEAKKALYVELHEVLKAELTPREEPKKLGTSQEALRCSQTSGSNPAQHPDPLQLARL